LHVLSEKSSTKFLLTLFFFCEDNKKQKHQASADVPLIVKIAADDFPFFRFFVSFDVNFCVASAKRITSFFSSICRRINFKPAKLNPTLFLTKENKKNFF